MGRKTGEKMREKIKIVHTITKLELGGAQTTTLYTLNNLPDDDYEKHLVCGSGGFLTAEANSSMKYKTHINPYLKREISFPGEKKLLAMMPYWFNIILDLILGIMTPVRDLLAYKDMIEYFSKLRPDIVHSHSSKAGIISRWAAKKAGVPIIIHTFHGFGFTPLQPFFIRWFLRWLEQKAAKKSTKLIFVSHANKEEAKREGIGTQEQYQVIRSGIDIDLFRKNKDNRAIRRMPLDEVEPVRLTETDKIVGNISCFKPQKALPDYIEACRKLKEKDKKGNYKFVLVGDGKLRLKLEKLVKKSGLADCFIMTGWRTDIEKILPGFDVMLHTSRYEGLSKVFLQAMAAGVPIVATDVDGASDVIKHGETGFLVKPEDTDAMAEYTYRLLEDDELRKRIADKEGSRLSEEFDLKVMTEKHDELYRKLIEKYRFRREI
ncbi:glycosyltransferase family 4 protein [Elusimicrobiota bacterium]